MLWQNGCVADRSSLSHPRRRLGLVTTEISQRDLRNDSGAILRAVESGEDFVVTRNGTALAELRPLRRRRFVAKSELRAAARQWAPIDAAAFRADVDKVLVQRLDRDGDA